VKTPPSRRHNTISHKLYKTFYSLLYWASALLPHPTLRKVRRTDPTACVRSRIDRPCFALAALRLQDGPHPCAYAHGRRAALRRLFVAPHSWRWLPAGVFACAPRKIAGKDAGATTPRGRVRGPACAAAIRPNTSNTFFPTNARTLLKGARPYKTARIAGRAGMYVGKSDPCTRGSMPASRIMRRWRSGGRRRGLRTSGGHRSRARLRP
jgi:hypothetical protein